MFVRATDYKSVDLSNEKETKCRPRPAGRDREGKCFYNLDNGLWLRFIITKIYKKSRGGDT